MTETFKALVGEITIDEKTIQLLQKDGRRYEWPPRFENVPRLGDDADAFKRLRIEGKEWDENLAKVIKAIRRRNRSYKRHPVIQRWIEHNKETISILRSTGSRKDPRVQKAEKQILKTAGLQSLRAAKKPYKRVDELAARRESGLRKAIAPIYSEWKKALDSGCSPEEKRKHHVIAKFIPSGYNTALAPNYDITLKAGIEEWLEVFEKRRFNLEESEYLTLQKIIQSHLEKDFASVNPSSIRRGRKRISKTLKNG